MNLAILGATGPTGTLLAEQALAAGHDVTALVRSPQKVTITDPNFRVIHGDATDATAVARALEGVDAVITTVGAKGPVVADATSALLAAAKDGGVQRVVMLSSFAVERNRLTPPVKLISKLIMGGQIKDRRVGEAALQASGLDWTIVYAASLTNDPGAGPTVVPETTKVSPSQKISRPDVASFLLQVVTEDLYKRCTVTITGAPGRA